MNAADVINYEKQKSVDHHKRALYSKKCVCGRTFKLLSQEFERSKYITFVTVICDCENQITFAFAVD